MVMQQLKLIIRFYKSFFAADILITLSCVFLLKVYATEAAEIIGILFWYKLICIGVVFYAVSNYKKRELYYYQNLGISKLRLGIVTSLFDFFVWLMLMLLTYKIK